MEWRLDGPFDVRELHDDPTDDVDEQPADADEPTDDDGRPPRIDLGSLILTGLPGSELRLQVSEDTQQIVLRDARRQRR